MMFKNRSRPGKMTVRLARVAALAIILCPPIMAGQTSQAATVKLFGKNEIQSTKMDKFKKWAGVLERYRGEEPKELAKCKLSATNKCETAKWRIFLKKIAGQPQEKQLILVNKYINKWLYVLDPINYNEKDYWATPRQFMTRNGDCEDYAIAKYASLVHLGFPKEEMRIVVLQDLNLKVAHAVLVVYVGGKALILDNQITDVVESNRIKHYKPIFSINEGAWWLHRG